MAPHCPTPGVGGNYCLQPSCRSGQGPARHSPTFSLSIPQSFCFHPQLINSGNNQTKIMKITEERTKSSVSTQANNIFQKSLWTAKVRYKKNKQYVTKVRFNLGVFSPFSPTLKMSMCWVSFLLSTCKSRNVFLQYSFLLPLWEKGEMLNILASHF